MVKKSIAQGIDNFKKMLDVNAYYVDKSLFIKDIIDANDQIILITRPRRFGKTLNMSMLKYFFENKECRKFMLEDVDTAYLFKGLKIWECGEEYRQEQGKYPVIYLTFKNAKQNNWEHTYQNIKEIIADEYRRHRYLLEGDILSDFEKGKYNSVIELKASEVEYTNVLKNLSEYLKRYFKIECMIIIDEYDTPIQVGYINGYFENIIEFMKSMLVKGFKDNNALKKGVLTGIMKVAQESIFSDFNNPSVNTVLSDRYKDKFGFTNEEVEEMAEYLGFTHNIEDIKAWYNGYIFGLDTVIYNPWSIIKYMAMPKDGFKPYWINTSDNRIIKEVMQLDKIEGKKVIEKLIKGEEVTKVIDENIVYQSIKDNPNVAWSFLLHAGYLKAYGRYKEDYEEEYSYKLAIPNLEVKKIYKDTIMNYFKEDAKISLDIEKIIGSLIDNDIEKFERLLRDLYLSQVSYNDTVKLGNIEELGEARQEERYENFHHGLFLGLFMMSDPSYTVESNKEYGLGRPDITIIPKDITKTAYVFEFKWESTRGPKTLDMLAEDAIKQIKEKKYEEGVKLKHGHEKVICIGVGFKGKELKMMQMKD